MTSSSRMLPDRSRGILLGAAVGDALGWPQEQNSKNLKTSRYQAAEPMREFQDWKRYGGTRFKRYIDLVRAGEYSDDTQLLLATARAIQTEDWLSTLTSTELPLFLLYHRGAGSATLRACSSWANHRSPWIAGGSTKGKRSQAQYFSAGGNGVAMRISPHVIANISKSRNEIISRILADGITTHGHPRALIGAAVYASAVRELLLTENTLEYGELINAVQQDPSWQDTSIALNSLPDEWIKEAEYVNPSIEKLWKAVVHETQKLLSHISEGIESGVRSNDTIVLESLGCFDKSINGAGTISSVAAIYLASRNAPNPLNGLVRAAFMKNADTDTMASMTGGLLGALHGVDWLGSLSDSVQDRSYIEKIADKCSSLALNVNHYEPPPARIRYQDVTNFRKTLLHENPLHFPDGRKISGVENFPLESQTGDEVRRWVFDVEEQSITIDIFEKASTSKKLKSSATLRWLSFPTANLETMENFYGPKGLGLSVQRTPLRELYVGDNLRFVELEVEHNFPVSAVLVDIQVENLEAITRQFSNIHWHGKTAKLKDPDGNSVWITQKPL